MIVLCHSKKMMLVGKSSIRIELFKRTKNRFLTVCRQAFRNHGFKSTRPFVQSAFSWVKSDALCCLPICVVDITFFAASFPISCSTLRLVSQALSLNSLLSVDSRICYICWLRLEKSSKTIFIPKHIDWAMGVVQNPLQLASSQFLPRPLFTTMFGLSSHCQCPKETV